MSNIFGGVVNTTSLSTSTVNSILQTVKQDMELLEKGRQWQFSSYSIAKDCASIPGLDDISPEELRLEAYQANQNGNISSFHKKIEELKQSYRSKRELLTNPTKEVVEIFRKIYSKENPIPTLPANLGVAANPVLTTSSIFGGQPPEGSLFGGSKTLVSNDTSSIFGGSSAFASSNTGSSASIFGGATQTSSSGGSIFGQSGSIFSSNSSSSVFGQNSTAAPSRPPQVFGQIGSSSTGIFGSVSANTGIFGSGTTSSGPKLFEQSSNTQGSVFGQMSANPFGAGLTSQPMGGVVFGQPSSFGGVATETGGTSFSRTQNSGFFGASSSSVPVSSESSREQTLSIFGSPSGSSIAPTFSPFHVPDAPQTTILSAPLEGSSGPLFGNRNASDASGNIFSSNFSNELSGEASGNLGTGMFGEQIGQQLDSSIYSTNLPPEIMEIYKSKRYELGNIPELPPPKELCC